MGIRFAMSIAGHFGVIGVMVVNEQTDMGDLVYLRYDPAARETTQWTESCRAAFNDALAAVVATVEFELPIQECRFYAIDWQQVTTKTDISFEGRSLTLAAALAIASYYGKFPLGHVLCTGDLSQDGRVLPVDGSGLVKKLKYINEIVASQFKTLVLPGGKENLSVEPKNVKIHRIDTLKQALKELRPKDLPIQTSKDKAKSDDEQASHQKSLMDMARVAMAGGDFNEAIRIFDKVLEIDSHHAEAWYQKGMALIKMSGREDEWSEAMAALAGRWNIDEQDADEQDQKLKVVSKACACLKEAVSIYSDYRNDVAREVSAGWDRLSDCHVPKIQEALKSAVAPEDIKILQKVGANLEHILTAIKRQHVWIDSPAQFERLQMTWNEVKQLSAARLKTLREIESDTKLEMALRRSSKSSSGDLGDIPKYVLYGGIFIFACYIFFIPFKSMIAVLGAIILLVGLLLLAYFQFSSKSQAGESPDMVKIWIKHGNKRGIEFGGIPGSENLLAEMSDTLEQMAKHLQPQKSL